MKSRAATGSAFRMRTSLAATVVAWILIKHLVLSGNGFFYLSELRNLLGAGYRSHGNARRLAGARRPAEAVCHRRALRSQWPHDASH